MNLKFWKKKESSFEPLDTKSFDASLGNTLDNPLNQPSGFPSSLPGSTFSPERADPFAPSAFGQPTNPGFSRPQFPEGSPFPQQPLALQPAPGHDRDTELIIAKLDAIKSELDSLHQRLIRLENQINVQQSQQDILQRSKRYANVY